MNLHNPAGFPAVSISTISTALVLIHENSLPFLELSGRNTFLLDKHLFDAAVVLTKFTVPPLRLNNNIDCAVPQISRPEIYSGVATRDATRRTPPCTLPTTILHSLSTAQICDNVQRQYSGHLDTPPFRHSQEGVYHGAGVILRTSPCLPPLALGFDCLVRLLVNRLAPVCRDKTRPRGHPPVQRRWTFSQDRCTTP